MIPKILHQTWKTRDIPPELCSYAESWKRLHPGWEYRLWTDQSAREFVAASYPRLLRKYDKYPYNIQRVDVARLLILAEYGGLYVDLDFEALRPVDSLLDSCTVLTKEAQDDAARTGRSLLVSNALIASEPRAPFLLHAIRRLPAGWPGLDVFDIVLNTTGPYFLTRAYESFQGAVKLLNETAFFSVGLEASRRPVDREKLMASGAYAIHHFESSWWPAPALAVPALRTVHLSTFDVVRR
jgi:mannosyltransferase OCH1-like enzyme